MDKEAQQRENPDQWTSLSIGTNFQHHIFYAFIRLGVQKSAYALLNVVTLYYVLFRPSIRKKAADYLKRRFKTKSL